MKRKTREPLLTKADQNKLSKGLKKPVRWASEIVSEKDTVPGSKIYIEESQYKRDIINHPDYYKIVGGEIYNKKGQLITITNKND